MGRLVEKKEIEKKAEAIIEETIQFDFPFLSSQDRRREIVLEKKQYVEEKLQEVAEEIFPAEDELRKIWEESVEQTERKFSSLSSKTRLNGFYLQELLHYYAGKIRDEILSMI